MVPVKTCIIVVLVRWFSKFHGDDMTKAETAAMSIKGIHDIKERPDIIRRAFKITGLYPLDPKLVAGSLPSWAEIPAAAVGEQAATLVPAPAVDEQDAVPLLLLDAQAIAPAPAPVAPVPAVQAVVLVADPAPAASEADKVYREYLRAHPSASKTEFIRAFMQTLTPEQQQTAITTTVREGYNMVREQMREMQATTREVVLAREAKRPVARRQPLTKGALFTSDEAVQEIQAAKRAREETAALKESEKQQRISKRLEKSKEIEEKRAMRLQQKAQSAARPRKRQRRLATPSSSGEDDDGYHTDDNEDDVNSGGVHGDCEEDDEEQEEEDDVDGSSDEIGDDPPGVTTPASRPARATDTGDRRLAMALQRQMYDDDLLYKQYKKRDRGVR